MQTMKLGEVTISRVIEIDLLEGLGVRPLPEPAVPVDYVLR